MDFIVPYEYYWSRYPHKYEALYHALKDEITGGRLKPGANLPSSRELARMYGLSRGTVNTVYETLASEGFLISGVGKGTKVNDAVSGSTGEPGACPQSAGLSDWGNRVNAHPLRTAREGGVEFVQEPAYDGGRGDGGEAVDLAGPGIRFDTGIAEVRSFPFPVWNRLLYAEVREMGSPSLREPFQAQGHSGLREAVAAYLNRNRGLRVTPEQVVIVNGSMQAIALLCQLLLNPGDRAAAEDPGYSGTRRAILAQGGCLVPVPAGSGLVPSVKASGARLVFVTPGRQFPTGYVLPLEARLELLEWAAEGGRILVEDDYDSEFRHKGRPLPPLKSLDRAGSVVYIGTFTKTLPPGHRIGYAVLPAGLAEPFVKAKQLYEPHPTALLEQRALARFMQSGQYERHLRRMKRIYGSRFHRLKEGLEQRLSECFQVAPSDSGLHLFVWWKRSHHEWNAFRDACQRAGVYWTETESYYVGEPIPSACFGFSHLTEEEISDGIARMYEVWRRLEATSIER